MLDYKGVDLMVIIERTLSWANEEPNINITMMVKRIFFFIVNKGTSIITLFSPTPQTLRSPLDKD